MQYRLLILIVAVFTVCPEIGALPQKNTRPVWESGPLKGSYISREDFKKLRAEVKERDRKNKKEAAQAKKDAKMVCPEIDLPEDLNAQIEEKLRAFDDEVMLFDRVLMGQQAFFKNLGYPEQNIIKPFQELSVSIDALNIVNKKILWLENTITTLEIPNKIHQALECNIKKRRGMLVGILDELTILKNSLLSAASSFKEGRLKSYEQLSVAELRDIRTEEYDALKDAIEQFKYSIRDSAYADLMIDVLSAVLELHKGQTLIHLATKRKATAAAENFSMAEAEAYNLWIKGMDQRIEGLKKLKKVYDEMRGEWTHYFFNDPLKSPNSIRDIDLKFDWRNVDRETFLLDVDNFTYWIDFITTMALYNGFDDKDSGLSYFVPTDRSPEF